MPLTLGLGAVAVIRVPSARFRCLLKILKLIVYSVAWRYSSDEAEAD